MIERGIVKRKLKEFTVTEFIAEVLDKPGYSHTEIQRTPLGEKIIIYTSRPGLMVGRKGSNIKELTETLKNKFGLENPQVEISEIENPHLNPHSVAKNIVHSFERFGPARFKFLGYKTLQDIINAGAIGAEIIISGRGVPSVRAKSWRFSSGHMKKSGNIAENFIKKTYAVAHLKTGAVGVKVSILTPDIELPDTIKLHDLTPEPQVEELKEEETKAVEEEIKEETKSDKTTKKEKPKETPEEPKKEEKVPAASELQEKKETKDGNNKKE